MDFDDAPHEAEFRARVRAWLSSNAEPCHASDDRTLRSRSDAELVAMAKAWQKKKALAGFAGLSLPKEFGGAGADPIEEVIYRQEERHFRVPFGVYEIGLGMCVPTLVALAADDVKARYVPPAIQGEEIWCQLFSEPGAGSDLAALQTRAQPIDGGWLINGQKVWTTGAQFSDFGLLLARTDPSAAKHAGLTMFIVNMKSPGVDVRPIKQMTGETDFNEVFFTDVRIADTHRLGAEGSGWQAAITTLMFERLNVGADIGLIDWQVPLEIARGSGAIKDGAARDKIAEWYLNSRGLALLTYRTITGLSRGRMPGPEQSLNKLVAARQVQEIADLCLDLAAERGSLKAHEIGASWSGVERAWAWGAAMRIAGGTDEILRNIIAERVLGLPPEPRFDKPYQENKSAR